MSDWVARVAETDPLLGIAIGFLILGAFMMFFLGGSGIVIVAFGVILAVLHVASTLTLGAGVAIAGLAIGLGLYFGLFRRRNT